ncbi:hypothetical protein APICC_01404 [Apis cerana cerana]|uniref:Uncharacterized protein n=1 Tax=Apis cerana cerana TaxID=94128 RepID=A0A2A3E3H3_APICC|nr:hypothetical protein APICC_01404 [Apis cerana cerana]
MEHEEKQKIFPSKYSRRLKRHKEILSLFLGLDNDISKVNNLGGFRIGLKISKHCSRAHDRKSKHFKVVMEKDGIATDRGSQAKFNVCRSENETDVASWIQKDAKAKTFLKES